MLALGYTLGFNVARAPLLANRWLRWILRVFLTAETAHFLASKLTRWGQASKVKAPRMQSAERLSLWRACLADPTIATESFITGWFRDARTGNSTVTAASPPLSELKRDNVLDWLAWSLWGTNYDRMGAEDRAELSLVFSMLEARLGEDMPGTPTDGQAGSSQAGLRLPFRFPPGRAPHVSSMQLEPRPSLPTRPWVHVT